MITITNEDCADLMKRTPDKYYDLAIVDPPYFNAVNKLGYYGQDVSKTNVKRNYYKPCESWGVPDNNYYTELCRVSKNQIIWGINYYNFENVPHGRIIWDKMKNESCTFSDGEIASCSLIETVRFFRYRWDGMLQENMKNKEKKIHPTQKPIDLYKWLLKNYAKKDDKIIDTHLGSGSIAIACIDMGFDLTACELDTDYYNSAMERIQNHSAQKELFEIKGGQLEL